jgi:hypothetical protein
MLLVAEPGRSCGGAGVLEESGEAWTVLWFDEEGPVTMDRVSAGRWGFVGAV